MAVTLNRPLDYKLPPYQLGMGPFHKLPFTGYSDNREKVVAQLAQCPVLKGKNTMLGVGGFSLMNAASVHRTADLDGLAARQIEHVVMVDNSLISLSFWEGEMAPLMRQPEVTRKDVIGKIQQIVLANHEFYVPFPNKKSQGGSTQSGDPTSLVNATEYCRQFMVEVNWNWNWLGSDERFNRIAKLFRENRVHFVSLDLCDPSAVRQLLENMQANNMQIETLEDSVRHFVTTDRWNGYIDSMNLLNASNPYVIKVKAFIDPWNHFSKFATLFLPRVEISAPSVLKQPASITNESEPSMSEGLRIEIPANDRPSIELLPSEIELLPTSVEGESDNDDPHNPVE